MVSYPYKHIVAATGKKNLGGMKGNKTTSEEVYLCIRNNLFLNTRSNSADTSGEPDFVHRIVLSASTRAKYAPNYTSHFELLFLSIVLYSNILRSKVRCYVLGKCNGSKSDTALKL